MSKPTIQYHRTTGLNVFVVTAVGLVIIVVAIIWLLFGFQSRVIEAPVNKALIIEPTAVAQFASYLKNNRAEDAMAKDHAYTSNGLRRLAAALESLSERDGMRTADIIRQLAELRQQADNIQADTRDSSHAASIRAAFITATEVMKTLQQQRYPDLAGQMVEVRQAAEAIESSRLTLAQKTEVGAFFAHADEVLQTMAQSPG